NGDQTFGTLPAPSNALRAGDGSRSVTMGAFSLLGGSARMRPEPGSAFMSLRTLSRWPRSETGRRLEYKKTSGPLQGRSA
ncbi:MAG: hypothetical protein ABSD29_24655, partial [Verrucomicrobiota bacterium]